MLRSSCKISFFSSISLLVAWRKRKGTQKGMQSVRVKEYPHRSIREEKLGIPEGQPRIVPLPWQPQGAPRVRVSIWSHATTWLSWKPLTWKKLPGSLPEWRQGSDQPRALAIIGHPALTGMNPHRLVGHFESRETLADSHLSPWV